MAQAPVQIPALVQTPAKLQTPTGGDPRAAQARAAEARFRCAELAQAAACAEALSSNPRDPELLVAEADALLRAQRPGEAIGVYRNALRSGAPRDAVNTKIAEAQAHRRPLLAACENDSGAAAERACEAAWLPGAADELTVFKRRGLLLKSSAQLAAALDAYQSAARLAPHDREVARAIVALTGNGNAADADTLTARGAALMTLGRPAAAIEPLRQALRLAPESAAAETYLRRARRAQQSQQAWRQQQAQQPLPAPRQGLAWRAFSNAAEQTRSN
jgi:tetratricopeptide (TPR) repeat protein